MRLGLDARFITIPSGIGRYTEQLLKHVSQLQGLEIIAFVPSNYEKSLSANIKYVRTDIPWYSLSEQTKLVKLFNEQHLDLLHVPHFNVPLVYRKPFVVTIHDLLLRQYPTQTGVAGGIKNLGYRWIIRQALKRSRAILAVSDFTKQEILTYYQLSPAKITVTKQASFLPLVAKTELKNNLISVGNFFPHKNVVTLLKAFAVVSPQYPDLKLQLIGHNNRYVAEIHSQIQEHCSGLAIRVITDSTDTELQKYYRQAQVCILPSLYEGYSLPGLEAMSQGVPVLASDIPCYQEVFGPAASYFPALSVEVLAAKLAALLSDKAEQERLRQLGREQSKQYSRATLAQETLAVYQKSIS